LAIADAAERAGTSIAHAKVELRARAAGAQVFLDVDVEAALAVRERAAT
jgi:guanylate kinase